jgi:hypothetical protein
LYDGITINLSTGGNKMHWEFEGVWDNENYFKYYDIEYTRFIAYLPSMESGEHNLSIYVNKDKVVKSEALEQTENRPEGSVKIYLNPGEKILRRTITVFKLNDFADESLPPSPFAENLEIPVSLMALPAS